MSRLKVLKNTAIRLRQASQVRSFYDYIVANPDCGVRAISLDDLMAGFNKRGDEFCARIDGTTGWSHINNYSKKGVRLKNFSDYRWPAATATFAVGDKVVISETSPYANSTSQFNPSGEVGTATAIRDSSVCRVQWAAGSNSYGRGDIRHATEDEIYRATAAPLVAPPVAPPTYKFSVGQIVKVVYTGLGVSSVSLGRLCVINSRGVRRSGSLGYGVDPLDDQDMSRSEVCAEKSFGACTTDEIISAFNPTPAPQVASADSVPCPCPVVEPMPDFPVFVTASPIAFNFATQGDTPTMKNTITAVESIDYVNGTPVSRFTMQNQIDLISGTEDRIKELSGLKTKTKLVTNELAKLKADLKAAVELFDALVDDDDAAK